MEHKESLKTEAINAIQGLPETANMEEIFYRLYVLENVRKGINDIELGKVKTTKELLKESAKW